VVSALLASLYGQAPSGRRDGGAAGSTLHGSPSLFALYVTKAVKGAYAQNSEACT
jgi:hypothetical protein